MKQIFLEYILPALLSLIGALASWALARLASHLRARTDAARWSLAVAQLADVARAAVAEAEVSLRPQFARAMADGKLSPEEGAALKSEVLRIVRERLAPQTWATLEAWLGSFVSWHLGGAVERAVVEDKLERGGALTPRPQ